MNSGEWYIVRQGESVECIASRRHQSWETVWNHPENARLRELRKSPHILYPGDELFVPALQHKQVSVDTGKRHPFQLKVAQSRLRVRFLIGDKPRANDQYVFSLDGGPEYHGATDGDGWLDRSVSAMAKQARVVFSGGDVFNLELKALDPVDTISGAQARLHALGYGIRAIDDEADERTRDALRSFQVANRLNPSGELDDATQHAFNRQDHGGTVA